VTCRCAGAAVSAVALCWLAASSAHAQRASENAVTSAEDAFAAIMTANPHRAIWRLMRRTIARSRAKEGLRRHPPDSGKNAHAEK